METPDDQDPQVILVVAEADLVSDLQQHFASRGVTIRFAEDPGAAREAIAVLPPRLVVLPMEGACQVLLEAWDAGTAPVELVIGLVAQPSDGSRTPKCVTRTARRGEAQEIVSLAELLLRGGPASAKPEAAAVVGAPAKESIWNRPGGILKNLAAEKLLEAEADAAAEEADFDASRVSDIRSLGVAVRMAKAARGGAGAKPSPAPGLSLRLSHGAEEEDAEERGKPAGITDAMSLLPQARAAESEEETIARLAAERAAKPVEGRPAVLEPILPSVVVEPEPVFKKSRKGLILVVTAVLVLAGGGVAAYLLLWPKPTRKSAGAAPVTRKKTADRPKRGLHEDHFAGTIAQLPGTVTALDVDVSDEFLNRSVPELDPYMELALRRLSRKKRRKTLLDRGLKLLGWERYPEARRFLKQAVELRDGPEARAGLSRAYEGLGRNWAAIAHLRQAAKRAPMNDSYQVRLGLLYLKENKKKPGCKALQRAAKLNKSHKGLVQKHCGKGKKRRRSRRRRRR